jgi:hypothetical protein
MRIACSLFALALLVISPSTRAAPCGGFVDVDSDNPALAPFCANVEWIRNRGITLGCAANLYCPNDSVTRVQMAAFMNRLGNALIHRLVIGSQTVGDLDLSSPAVICLTNPESPASYERRAAMVGRVSATSNVAGPSTFVIAPVYSSDGGVTFTQGGGGQAWVTSLGTATWVTAAGVGSAFMSAGATYRFGISVQGVLGTTGLSNVSCGISSDIRPRDIDD